MRIYVFKSEATNRLRAFAGDPDVNKLPHQHGPWTATGTISPDNAPPFNLSRDAIEKASMQKAFNFGDCATRSDTNQRSVRPKSPVSDRG